MGCCNTHCETTPSKNALKKVAPEKKDAPPSTSTSGGGPGDGTDEKKKPCVRITRRVKVRRTEEGRKINGYLSVNTLGTGSFSKVKLVMDLETNLGYAMKIMDKNKLKKKRNSDGKTTAYDDVLQEVEIMKILASSPHKNVLQLIEVIDDPSHDLLYLVLESCPEGRVLSVEELFSSGCGSGDEEGDDDNVEKKMSVSEVRKLFHGVLRGLEHVHSLGVFHADIKPSNLLRDEDGVVKLADFGVSRFFDVNAGERLRGAKGTPTFQPPELFQNTHDEEDEEEEEEEGEGDKEKEKEEKGRGYDPVAVDIYSAGVTLFVLLFMQMPFMGDTFADLVQSVKKNDPKFPDGTDELTKQFIRWIIKADPKERPGVKQILQHEWMQKKD